MRKGKCSRRLVFGIAVLFSLASCSRGGPAPPGVAGQGRAGRGGERLLLSEAVAKARAHLARLGFPQAQLWRVEGGGAFGRDGRAVWKLRLCDPADGGQIFYDFEYPLEEQRAATGLPMPGPCNPLTGPAPPEEVAARNPRIWQLVAEKEGLAQQLLADLRKRLPSPPPGALEEAFQVKVGIQLGPFFGPSATYEHGRDAWVVTVDYPTEVDEAGRVVGEGCSFWASIDTGEPLWNECGQEEGSQGEHAAPPTPGGTAAGAAPFWWRRYEDFEFEDPRSRWQLSPPGGCTPTSSEVGQSIDGSLRQAARGGRMDGKDCAVLSASRDFAVPGEFIRTRQPIIAFSWRVPEFSSPTDPQAGKEGYADLLVIPLDRERRELGRLRFRISCDDRSGSGTSYCSPPTYGMSDGSHVSLVHGKGPEARWQSFSAALGPGQLRTPGISPEGVAAIDWSRAATTRLAFEFAAGYMYNDAWAVEWDDLVTRDVVAFGGAAVNSAPTNVTVVDRGYQYTFTDVDEVRHSDDVGSVSISPGVPSPPDFELGDLDLQLSFAAVRSFKRADTGASSALTKGYLWNTTSATPLPDNSSVWSCLDKYIQVSNAEPPDLRQTGFQVEPHGTYWATLSAAALGGASVWFDVDVVDLTAGRWADGDAIDAGVTTLLWATNLWGDIYQRGLNARSVNPGAFPTDDFWFPRFSATPGHQYRISICTQLSFMGFFGTLLVDVNSNQHGLWLASIDLRPVRLGGGGGGCWRCRAI